MTEYISADTLNAIREDSEIEAKGAQGRSGRGEVPNSIWETYSAMANTSGGTIILGAEENADGSLRALGLKEVERVQRDFWSSINNPQKVSVNLLQNENVRPVLVEGCPDPLLWIDVPQAPRHKRPVFIGADYRTGTYRRGYEGDFRVTDEQELRRLFAESQQESRDGRILEGLDIEALDSDSIARFRTMVAAAQSRFTMYTETIPLLRAVGAWGPEDNGHPTLAGLLMFGRLDALLAVMPLYMVDYRERIDTTERWSHRIHHLDGTWSGNLFDFYRLVRRQLQEGLPQPFVMREGRRIQDDTAERALREALTNTLIHADYDLGRAILIQRFADRVEFRNPGELRIPVDRVYAGGTSDCRNRNLQRMFQAIGEGEQGGTGYPTMLEAARQTHWWPPVLHEDRTLPDVTLTVSMSKLVAPKIQEELERRFGPVAFDRTRPELIALETAAMEGAVTNARLRVIAGVDSTVAAAALRRLVAEGLLLREGERQQAKYLLAAGVPPEEGLLPAAGRTRSEHDGLPEVGSGLPTDPGSIPHISPELPTDPGSIPHISPELPTDPGSIPHTAAGDQGGAVISTSAPERGIPRHPTGLSERDVPHMMRAALPGTAPDPANADDRQALAVAIGLPEAEVAALLALPRVHQVRSTVKAQTALVKQAIMEVLTGRYLTSAQLGVLLNRHPNGLQERYLAALLKDGRIELRYPEQFRHPEQAYRAVARV